MTSAIDVLMSEHRLLERIIAALVAFVDEVRRKRGDAAAEKAELAQFVALPRRVADLVHAAKEEDMLFAEMVSAGFPREGGPVQVVREAQALARAEVSRLAALASQATPWSGADRQRLAHVAYAYADLMRRMIYDEEVSLYPLAERILSRETLQRVGDAFHRLDEGRAGPEQRDPYATAARRLIRAHAPLGVPDEDQE